MPSHTHESLEIAQGLVRCPSVTPREGGALSYLQGLLEPAGFACHRLTFSAPGTPDVENLYAPAERVLTARHKTYQAYQRITLTSVPATKMTVYGDLLRAMLTDQLAFIAEPSHTRVITEDNGRESLRMSVRATQLASSSCA